MSEFSHQAALIAFARNPAVVKQYPGIDLLHSSLNGVKLSKAQAGKAKASGMLAGVYDLCLPVRRGPYVGMYLEMKYGRNKLTPEQEWYGQRLREEGWYTAVCYNWLQARDEIIKYLQQLDLFADQGAICAACGGSIT